MYVLLILLGKAIQAASRLFHNSGAALPGLIIERLKPDFLEKVLKKLPDGVVVISGTNGKTTTTKLVADTLAACGERIMTNRTGSNMTRGLISTIVSRANIFGKLPYDAAVLEVDEAYAAVLAKKVPIRAALVLNVMRDQLDRFGEIDTTASYLSELTAAAREFVVLNAGDKRVAKLKVRAGAKKVDFIGSPAIQKKLLNEDAWHSRSVRAIHADADFVLEASSGKKLRIRGLPETATRLEGVHNHMNFTAAFTLVSTLLKNVPAEDILAKMADVKPAFGRGETIEAGNSSFDILLVKNPSSFMQTVSSTQISTYDTVTVMINDAYADSRDVSWLWDVGVDGFSDAKKLFTAGTRGADMAVRLKYAEVDHSDILGNEKQTVRRLSGIPGRHAVFCTYTAMLGLRKELVRRGHTEQVK